MARHLSVIVILAITAFLGLSLLMSFGDRTDKIPQALNVPAGSSGSKAELVNVEPVMEGTTERKLAGLEIASDLMTGDAIAPKLENATLKAELGRASWKLFHTMMARFPEKPSEDDQLALKTYIHLFARLYPCGDCARHFQQLLKKFPPQVGSRNSAAGWACHVHNQVNERLKHPLFDCNDIGDFYDCGCGDEDKKKAAETAGELKKEA
ncbi:FAD-linked sulfhydryl oxidase ALR [Xylariales sp. AK1849]|nr:FAD-linked sulfhydryl oxidase ALR [Xylariales sp. AK1849]